MAKRRGTPTTLQRVERTLELGERATLVAVADTHSRPHPAVDEQLRALKPAAILHAGDVGDLSVLDGLEEIAPLYAVRGNIDARGHGDLPDVLTLKLVQGARRLTILLTHIAVRGPRLSSQGRAMAAAHGADLLVCGHSHVPLLAKEGSVVVFNPGSIGPRRFALPITYGIMQLTPSGITIEHRDCETGARWAP